jgi:pimeloyl-ACP methyl ester carboxylesterase
MAAERMLKTFAAAIFFFGATTAAFAQQLDAAAPSAEPMPGFLDGDAGARKLRYRCAGEGAPIVLIEAGGAISFETLYSWERTQGFRPGWLDVIAGIEKASRVCVYDRAGLGRSDKAPLPRTSADVATDLRALLRNEKIATPVVCVGQSFGGSNCRIFASRYPKLIAGMVLVDTSDADFWPRVQALQPPLTPPDLSKSAEGIDLRANAALLRKAKGLGDKPLIVLTASPTSTDPMIPATQQQDVNRIHQELQRELLGLSANSRQVIATKAGHNIQRDEPQLIVDAVIDVVKQVRGRQ